MRSINRFFFGSFFFPKKTVQTAPPPMQALPARTTVTRSHTIER